MTNKLFLMKPINKLRFGFTDATNYSKRENKIFFNSLFVRTEDLDSVLSPTNYFIIGDKGTGKTALSVYLSNSEIRNFSCDAKFIGDTDYRKFITLKESNHISISDYEDIWIVILYLMLAKQIRGKEEDRVVFSRFSRFRPLDEAIEQFYNKAFSPEISYAINFVNNAKKAAKLIHDSIELHASNKTNKEYTETNFQLNLLYLKKKFEDAIQSLNLAYSHILFIDGIDLRPVNVSYNEYLQCITGLVQATWKINSNFFANIKGSKGRIKIVLLMRPDIINSVGLQNVNAKVKDNSVLLDWKTTYKNYRQSNLFKVIDNLLASQQENKLQLGEAWDYYFPYKVFINNRQEDSFVSFLRYSMFKPRDILAMLSILQENFDSHDRINVYPVFNDSDFKNSDFFRKYSEYLLGEIQDYVSFYHAKDDYELLLKFFEFMEGTIHFNYEEYIEIYSKFADYVERNEIEVPVFFESSDKFLQFLYEMNIICYIERTEEDQKDLFRWSYRERSISNPSPKVKEGVDYSIHYGLTKAIKVGKKLKRRSIQRHKKK